MSSGAPHARALGPHSISPEIGPNHILSAADSERSWADLEADFRTYLERTARARLVFVGPEGDLRAGAYTHRFQRHRSMQWYAKIPAFTRGAQAAYTDPWLGLVTLSTTTTDDDGHPRPPIDHLGELLEPWPVVRRELRSVMNADRVKDRHPPREWEYLSMLEATTDAGFVLGGYGHRHVAVVSDGPPCGERLAPVLAKHVDACPGASTEAHEPVAGALEVRPMDDFKNVGAYVAKYLGEAYLSGRERPWLTRFNAVLWDTGRRRVSVSDGAQAWVRPPEELEAAEGWEFLGACDEVLADELVGIGDPGYAREMLGGDASDDFAELIARSRSFTQLELADRGPGFPVDNPDW